jgi:hypothetical protein
MTCAALNSARKSCIYFNKMLVSSVYVEARQLALLSCPIVGFRKMLS